MSMEKDILFQHYKQLIQFKRSGGNLRPYSQSFPLLLAAAGADPYANVIGITPAALELIRQQRFKSKTGVVSMHMRMQIDTFMDALDRDFETVEQLTGFYAKHSAVVFGTREENRTHTVPTFIAFAMEPGMFKPNTVDRAFAYKREGRFLEQLWSMQNAQRHDRG